MGKRYNRRIIPETRRPLKIDPEEIRRHYASLTDEALLDLNPNELSEAARSIYDEALAQRYADPERQDPLGLAGDAAPDWLEDAACAISFPTYPGSQYASDAAEICEALGAAGIPCHITARKQDGDGFYEYCVMVPGALNLLAVSVLDKEVLNARVEAEWRTHFQVLSDEDLSALSPETICAGFQDRIERLTRAYNDEVARRTDSADADGHS
jgi:hypothetical protein